MNHHILTIIENTFIAKNTYKLLLRGPTLEEQHPGRFVNLLLPGLFLRRPLSVCDSDPGSLLLVYKTVGRGTEQLSALSPGETLDVLTDLGNGYGLSPSGESPLLLGGGAGVPPLYLLARRLRLSGRKVTAVLGFNTAAEAFGADAFRALGCDVTVTTADGSLGRRGFVTDAMPPDYTYFYACGPEPMLRAVHRLTLTSGQFSLEERMGCGFGACMGCTCRTPAGPKRICREGPVLEKEEILWEG